MVALAAAPGRPVPQADSPVNLGPWDLAVAVREVDLEPSSETATVGHR